MSTETGHRAETAASLWLKTKGFRIIARNWRTRYCEIDIIAVKIRDIYFVEVKYRRKSGQGTGFDYITSEKQNRMIFAAELFMSKYNLDNQYFLYAAEVGEDYQISNFAELFT